jgi:hypothetical protein
MLGGGFKMEGCRHQQVHSSNGIEAFSTDFQAEEDVSFIKNNKRCTMAQAWRYFDETLPQFAKDDPNIDNVDVEHAPV